MEFTLRSSMRNKLNILVAVIFQMFPAGVLAISPPNIDRISPDNVVLPGEWVTLEGSYFGYTFWDSDVLYVGEFDDPVSPWWIEIDRATWSDKKISFSLPSEVTQGGYIYVSSCDSDGLNCSDFQKVEYYLQPVIDSLSSSVAQVGDAITITGSHLLYGFPSDKVGAYTNLQVYINGVAVGADYIADQNGNDFSIEFTVPEWATTGLVTIELSDESDGRVLNAIGPELTILQPSANDEYSALQQFIQQVGIDQAWNYTTGDSDVVVAVIDSGVDTNHVELTDNIWSNIDEIAGNNIDDDRNGYVDDVHGFDFVSDVAELTPNDGHGTMVAGVIGAVGNNGIGVTGINWNVQIMPLIALDRDGGSVEQAAKAIRYAADNGADVINMSFGGAGWTNDYQAAYDEAIEYAFKKGVLLVAAAGNGDVVSGTGVNLDINPNSPVCNNGDEDWVLGVGSVDSSNVISSFSDFGSSCIDVMAPGENVLSLSPAGYSSYAIPYDLMDGTSFSAPIVSGIAALIKSRYPSMTNVEIAKRIKDTATNIDDINGWYAGRLGAGIVNAFAAVSQDYTPTVIVDKDLTTRMLGRILLQVESVGEAWYVNPADGLRYYMEDGSTAYQMMRSFSLGITTNDLEKISSVETSEEMLDATSVCSENMLANSVRGKILLQVESHGEAWYVHPDTCRRIYMADGDAAYTIMRYLSLGITDADLAKLVAGD